MSEPVWHRVEEWVGTEVEDSFVMINLNTGAYVTMNRTACAIWNALETPQTQHAIEEGLRSRFEVSSEQCRSEVTLLLSDMLEKKLAAPISSPSR